MAVKKRYSGLGRGLDALISTEEVKTQGSSSIHEVPVSQIKANPNQPRREFDQTALQELADSIAEIGIIQPITLRKMEDDTYQIIAGERRVKASVLAGLEESIFPHSRSLNSNTEMEEEPKELSFEEQINALLAENNNNPVVKKR